MTRNAVNRVAPFILLAGIAWGVSAFGGSPKAPQAAAVKISARAIPGLGEVLVNSSGRTLYMFVPDHQKEVTCVKVSCTALWPPVILKAGQKPVAEGAVKQAMLGSVPNPAVSGERVVTYNGWPLYTYTPDIRPGLATGQALNLNGGLWYVMSPAGKVIKTALKK